MPRESPQASHLAHLSCHVRRSRDGSESEGFGRGKGTALTEPKKADLHSAKHRRRCQGACPRAPVPQCLPEWIVPIRSDRKQQRRYCIIPRRLLSFHVSQRLHKSLSCTCETKLHKSARSHCRSWTFPQSEEPLISIRCPTNGCLRPSDRDCQDRERAKEDFGLSQREHLS